MSNPWMIEPLEITIRLLAALVLGGLIGWEREQSNRAAGLRTHILVCLGATLIMLLSIYGFNDFVDEPNVRIDPARLAAQVVSGIGFLGAGVIMFNGLSITGLTTAASLWVVAAIGLGVGAGFYFAAALATLIVLFSLLFLSKVERKWFRSKRLYSMKLEVVPQDGMIEEIQKILSDVKADVHGLSIGKMASLSGPDMTRITVQFLLPNDNVHVKLLQTLSGLPFVHQVSTEM